MNTKKFELQEERLLEAAFTQWVWENYSRYVQTPQIEKLNGGNEVRFLTQTGKIILETQNNLSEVKTWVEAMLQSRIAFYTRLEKRLITVFWDKASIVHNINRWENPNLDHSFLMNGNNERISIYIKWKLPANKEALIWDPFVTEEQILESICAKLDEKEESGLDLPTRDEFLEKWNNSSQILLGENQFYENNKGVIEKKSPAKILFEEDKLWFDSLISRIKNRDQYIREKSSEISLLKADRNLLSDTRKQHLESIESKYAKLILSPEELKNVQNIFLTYFTKPPLRFATNSPQLQVIELVEQWTKERVFALYVKPSDLIKRKWALVYFWEKREFDSPLPWEETTKVSQLWEEGK
jgi:hypothetical protein